MDAPMAVVLVMAIFYFVPTITSLGGRKTAAIFALNLLLGWTFVGWVVALVWALADDKGPRRIKCSHR